VDANQAELTQGLREHGYSVDFIHMIGRGRPDLLVGKFKKNWLLEVKDPRKKLSQRQMTEDERAWHAGWLGQVDVVETLEDCLRVCQ
jgi:hypothetical protein